MFINHEITTRLRHYYQSLSNKLCLLETVFIVNTINHLLHGKFSAIDRHILRKKKLKKYHNLMLQQKMFIIIRYRRAYLYLSINFLLKMFSKTVVRILLN